MELASPGPVGYTPGGMGRRRATGSGRRLSAVFLLATVRALHAQEPAPENRVLINGGARITNVRTVQITVRLKSPPPPDLEMALSTESVAPGPWTRFVESQPFELSAQDGLKTVVVHLREGGGKDLPSLQATILLDTTPPVARVTAPAQASGRTLRLSSDVPDAVAMQWTEDATRWNDWVPYSQPREIELSPGAGPKTVLVRYRDEAGNVSSPATLHVEVGSEISPPGVQELRVFTLPSTGALFPVIVRIPARSLQDMTVQVDQEQARAREAFVPELRLDLPRTGGAHRLRFLFRDDTGREHPAEVAFQESEVPSAMEHGAPEPPVERRWAVAVLAGLLPHAVSFEAMTPQGLRKINPELLGMGRLELGFDLADPVFVQAAFEYAGGGDTTLYSGTLDAGAHLLSTELFGSRLTMDVEAGVLYSKLRVTLSDFGTFDPGVGFRAGATARAGLTDRWGLEASADYRDVTYPWGGSVLSGDHRARLRTAALMLGVSLRF